MDYFQPQTIYEHVFAGNDTLVFLLYALVISDTLELKRVAIVVFDESCCLMMVYHITTY